MRRFVAKALSMMSVNPFASIDERSANPSIAPAVVREQIAASSRWALSGAEVPTLSWDCEQIARRSVVETATPKPRWWVAVLAVSVLSVRPDHQKRTTFGWNPTPGTAPVVVAPPVPMLNAPTFAPYESSTLVTASQFPAAANSDWMGYATVVFVYRTRSRVLWSPMPEAEAQTT